MRALLGLDDVIFDLSITPNRPDAMCIVGVARELAAHFGWPLDVPEPVAPAAADVASDISVQIDAPDRCPRYLGRVARVTLGPSPAWMAERLVKAGMRPISNVVDVTNYVLLERNQPLHAFDLARLGGRGILVRVARDGERMTTLDGVERELAPEDLLICDADGTPQAIAGIMGGSTSEVSDATTEILLESAYFERMGIARSSKRLKLRSESSARFERGIDPNGIAVNAARAMELLVQVAGAAGGAGRGRRVPDPDRAGADPRAHEQGQRDARHRAARLRRARRAAAARDRRRGLGRRHRRGRAHVPARPRPRGRRHRGGGAAASASTASAAPSPVRASRSAACPARKRERRAVADALLGAGFSEAITLPLVAPVDLERAGAPVDRVVEAANPLRAEESVLRTRILPGLLRAVARNRVHGIADVSLFETGHVFLAPVDGAVLPDEPLHVALVVAGTRPRRPVEDDRAVDPFDATDGLREVFDALELADARFEGAAHRGLPPRPRRHGRRRRRARRRRGSGRGPVLDRPRSSSAPVVAAEVDLDALLGASRRDRSFRMPSPYPPSSIDLAFVVGERVEAEAVAATLRAAAGDLLEDLRLFDEFRADALGAGRRSLAFALRFRAPDRTLTDAEVAEVRSRAIAAVERAHGAELRG